METHTHIHRYRCLLQERMTINKVGSQTVAKHQSVHLDKKGGWGRWVRPGCTRNYMFAERVTFLHEGRSGCMCVIDPWTDVCTEL